MIEKCLR